MKINIIILFLLSSVIRIAAQKNAVNLNFFDSISVTKLLELNISANQLTKGMYAVWPFEISNDTLYLINRTKFLKIDLKTGKVSSDIVISNFLKKLLSRSEGARKIIVKDGVFYISFFDEIYSITEQRVIEKLFECRNFIKDFNIAKDFFIIATRQDSIILTNKKGKLLASTVPFSMEDGGFIRSLYGIFYNPIPQRNIFQFQSNVDNNIVMQKLPPPASKNINELNISYINDNFLIGFPETKRNAIYIFKRSPNNYLLYKTINLKKFNCTPTQNELMSEEGEPNFRIAYDKGKYYIISLTKGKLKVLAFKL